jgi:hypothetical protein
MAPTATREWPRILADAKAEAASGKYDEGDRRLAAFEKTFPGTAEAVETFFWRGVFRLDPSNPSASPRQAAELLDRYLASTSPGIHQTDARVLRRTATLIEQHTKAVAAAKHREDELQRTKDELAKTLAELDRIKRRIASPNP